MLYDLYVQNNKILSGSPDLVVVSNAPPKTVNHGVNKSDLVLSRSVKPKEYQNGFLGKIKS